MYPRYGGQLMLVHFTDWYRRIYRCRIAFVSVSTMNGGHNQSSLITGTMTPQHLLRLPELCVLCKAQGLTLGLQADIVGKPLCCHPRENRYPIDILGAHLYGFLSLHSYGDRMTAWPWHSQRTFAASLAQNLHCATYA